MLGILIILIVWFVQMPLWLSIIATCYGSFYIMFGTLKIATALFRFSASADQHIT